MRTFKKIRSIDLPYNKQGEIYFTCINYKGQNKLVRNKIDRLCKETGGVYAPALFAFITSDRCSVEIAHKFYVSESLLYKLRKKFYESW